MMRGFLWGSGILLVALLIFVFWDRGDESQRLPVPQEEHVPAQAPAVPEQTTPDLLPEEDRTPPPPPPPPPAPLATEESSSSVAEGKQSATDAIALARQFLLDLRNNVLHIGKLRAIREGRYSLKEGEKEPDLHAEYKALGDFYLKIDGTALKEGLAPRMEEVLTEAGTLMQGLSSPPADQEIADADSKRIPLQQKIDALAKEI